MIKFYLLGGGFIAWSFFVWNVALNVNEVKQLRQEIVAVAQRDKKNTRLVERLTAKNKQTEDRTLNVIENIKTDIEFNVPASVGRLLNTISKK